MTGSHPGAKGQMKSESLHSGGKRTNEFDQTFGAITDKMWKQGMSPKEAMGVSPSYLESIYAQAYRLYNTGKYAEAAHLFRILVMFNAMEPKYMLGLAACFHMLKEYVNAIQTYTMCSALDADNPIPHYHSSDCFIQMKEYLSALLCLELAIERCGDKQEYAKMKERAQLSLESLKQQAQSTPLDENPRSSQELQERKIF
jgi:type III secretion system low calcium response chaperone LcrH/SycD